MAVEERDPFTGHLTTGHEWNGIKELNTRVPRAVYFFLIVTFLFGVGYWLLMPAWPTGTSYTKGLLGIDQRNVVTQSLKQAEQARAPWTDRIEKADFVTIQNDAGLMANVRGTGHTLFGDNCAACHGLDAKGGKGFPNLTTAAWLWGGTPEAIAETVRVGINAPHPETRSSQMLAFGRDGMLQRPDIDNLVAFVRSQSNPVPNEAAAKQVEAGKALFAANCASCHGDNAKGSTDLGAPDLTDANWIYGGDAQSIHTSIWGARQGHMPSWEARLSELDRKILTLYLLDLRKATP
jgi:cytochrome c oxidase cbb3-type subunit 3